MKIPHELGLKRPSTEFDEVLKLIDEITLANAAVASKRDKDGAVAVERANTILTSLAGKLAAVATIGWKMQKRMTDPESGETRDAFDESDGRKLARDVQALLSTLTDMGITIRDRAGQAFDYGMPEKVVDAKAMKGISKERVAETLRPTVSWTTDFWKETIIQKGEVIIHTPES
jgi:hypothetical protein